MSPTTLPVTGATGFIGSRLATLALERGQVVRTLTRSDWSNAPFVPVANRFFGRLVNQIPVAAVNGTEVVVHCAALLEVREHAAHAVTVTGTVRLAEIARTSGVRTILVVKILAK